jgi:glyoxylase-like metal-dependent hydrolase (beta-lactamase superfamily II)
MKIGDWNIRSCLAGKFGLDGGAMFGVVPKTMWSKLLPADDKNRIPMVMRTMLIEGPERKILVDTGMGGGYEAKYNQIYNVDQTVNLAASLESAGLAAEDITDVILTHLHFDHAAGVAAPDGAGWRLLFPQAAHHVQKRQYEHALSPNPRDRASYFPERIEIMEREGVLTMYNGPWSPAPGIDLFTVDGHTPGQQLVKVSDGKRVLCYCGDLFPTTAHLPVPFVMSYDLDPVLAMQEKERILDQAYREKWLLFFEHDPDTAACYPVKEDKWFVKGETVEL